MQLKIFFSAFLFWLTVLSEGFSSGSLQTTNYQAYLTVSFLKSAVFQDSISHNLIKSNIEKVFENNGIKITHIEKPGEYKLSINIIIGDSLIINADGIGAGDAASITVIKKPRKTYVFSNEKEIYNSIDEYIKEYL